MTRVERRALETLHSQKENAQTLTRRGETCLETLQQYTAVYSFKHSFLMLRLDGLFGRHYL